MAISCPGLAHNHAMPEMRDDSPSDDTLPSDGTPPMPQHPPRPLLVRWLLMTFAVFCLVMGVIGIVVPGLPTTVFILMAGWAAARSSPRLHAWLWHHRLFGPMLQEWSHGGRVSRKTKWSASIVMSLCACVLLVSHAPFWVKVGANACMACVLAWLWFRPEPPSTTSR